MIIAKGNLEKGVLSGRVAIVTGAGGGIGFETARSLLWLGAKVVIAEIDKTKGKNALDRLRNEYGKENIFFCHTDVQKKSIQKLHRFAVGNFGRVDIIINNAIVATVGAVHEVAAKQWDRSYGVNLRGPVLLLRYFLPDMIKRNEGTVVFVPSSGAAPYLGAYEVFKTAQVELANTLAAELENTGVLTYSIGPGIVKTHTAQRAISELAPRYGMTVEELFQMNASQMLSEEEAGAGFAASVVLAEKYRGVEIGSIQALMDAGIDTLKQEISEIQLSDEQKDVLSAAVREIKDTFSEQVEGWRHRNVFEKQWIFRDFKKNARAAPEHFIAMLEQFESGVAAGLQRGLLF